MTRHRCPAGHVLYETPGYISQIRFWPKGDRIAFVHRGLSTPEDVSIREGSTARFVAPDGRRSRGKGAAGIVHQAHCPVRAD